MFNQEVTNKLEKLAEKSIQRSGNKFFGTLQKRTVDILNLREEDLNKKESSSITVDNLILLARYRAGEVGSTGGKRKRGGSPTNADKVEELLKNTTARVFLEVIILCFHMAVAMNECEKRAEAAANSEHWTKEIGDIDWAEKWDERGSAIEEALPSWEEASLIAKQAMDDDEEDDDWEKFKEAFGELHEIETD